MEQRETVGLHDRPDEPRGHVSGPRAEIARTRALRQATVVTGKGVRVVFPPVSSETSICRRRPRTPLAPRVRREEAAAATRKRGRTGGAGRGRREPAPWRCGCEPPSACGRSQRPPPRGPRPRRASRGPFPSRARAAPTARRTRGAHMYAARARAAATGLREPFGVLPGGGTRAPSLRTSRARASASASTAARAVDPPPPDRAEEPPHGVHGRMRAPRVATRTRRAPPPQQSRIPAGETGSNEASGVPRGLT